MKLVEYMQKFYDSSEYQYDKESGTLIVNGKLSIIDGVILGGSQKPITTIELPEHVVFKEPTVFMGVAITNRALTFEAKAELNFVKVQFQDDCIAEQLIGSEVFISKCLLDVPAETGLITEKLHINKSPVKSLHKVQVKGELCLNQTDISKLGPQIAYTKEVVIKRTPLRYLPLGMQSDKLVLKQTELVKLPVGFNVPTVSIDSIIPDITTLPFPRGGVVNVYKHKGDGKVSISILEDYLCDFPDVYTPKGFYNYINQVIHRCGLLEHDNFELIEEYKQLKKEVRAAVKRFKEN